MIATSTAESAASPAKQAFTNAHCTKEPDVAEALIIEAVRRGVLLISDGHRLRYRVLTTLPTDLADRIRANRADVIAALRNDDVSPEDRTPYKHQRPDTLAEDMGNPFRGTCTHTPRRQRVVDLLADLWDTKLPGSQDLAVSLSSDWKERVAHCEIDGNMTPLHAEDVAWYQIRTAVQMFARPEAPKTCASDRKHAARSNSLHPCASTRTALPLMRITTAC